LPISLALLYFGIFLQLQHVKVLKYMVVGAAVGLTLSAHACNILEFGSENLLYPGQDTSEINFQEVKAFADGIFLTQPIFTGSEPRFETGLNEPIDLTGFGYAVIHYAPGTSGNPTFNRGGCLVFYFIADATSCSFTFPQTGPGDSFSNGRITSVTLFISESIPDAGTTVMFFAIALGGLAMVHRVAKQ
jgi:hypothetical protein